jgi:tetratricopeptide (TPR) repeat protein
MCAIENPAIVNTFLGATGPVQRASCQRYLDLFSEGASHPPDAVRAVELNALIESFDGESTGAEQTAGEVFGKRVSQLDARIARGPEVASNLRAIQELLSGWILVTDEAALMGNVVAVGAAEYANGTVKLAFWLWTLATVLAVGRGEWELADALIEELVVEVLVTPGAGESGDIVTELMGACLRRSQAEAILAWLNWPLVRAFCYLAPVLPSLHPFSGGLQFWDRAALATPPLEAAAPRSEELPEVQDQTPAPAAAIPVRTVTDVGRGARASSFGWPMLVALFAGVVAIGWWWLFVGRSKVEPPTTERVPRGTSGTLAGLPSAELDTTYAKALEEGDPAAEHINGQQTIHAITILESAIARIGSEPESARSFLLLARLKDAYPRRANDAEMNQYANGHPDEYVHDDSGGRWVYNGRGYRELITRFPASDLADDAAFAFMQEGRTGAEQDAIGTALLEERLKPAEDFLKRYPDSEYRERVLEPLRKQIDSVLTGLGSPDLAEYYDLIQLRTQLQRLETAVGDSAKGRADTLRAVSRAWAKLGDVAAANRINAKIGDPLIQVASASSSTDKNPPDSSASAGGLVASTLSPPIVGSSVELGRNLLGAGGAAPWYEDYEAGITAVRKGEWAAVVQKMTAAIIAHDRESDFEHIYGTLSIRYHPHYYRGLAYLNTGKYDQAVSEFTKASGRGEVDQGSLDILMERSKAKLRAANEGADH